MVHVEHEVEPVEEEREQLQRSYERFVRALDERGWLDPLLREAAFTEVGEER